MKKLTKKMWAFLLTLIMAVSMMATSVTVFADAGADDMVANMYIGDKEATYSDFTVGDVTNYYYDAILPSGTDLTNLTVEVSLASEGTATLDGKTSSGQDLIFEGVDLDSPQYMVVTIGGVERSYRVAACGEGEFYVEIAIRMNKAAEWAADEGNDADMREKVAAAADALRVPNNDLSETTFETVRMEAGETVMDALEKVACENKIDLVGVENNYIQEMGKDGAIIGDPYKCEVHCGSMSGWMYWVDGELPMVGAGNYTLNGSEKIEWKYITDYSDIM